MSANGEVNITIVDGGAASILVPGADIQVAIGVCSGGVVDQIVSTSNPNTVQSVLGFGPLAEYAGLVTEAGGVVLAIKAAQTAAGTASAPVPGASNTSSSALTTTLDGTVGAFDDYFVVVDIVNGGTRGTAGWTFQVSLDAGRTFGPVINPGTAVTYAIPNTGVTLNFGAGSLVAGDSWTFGTVAPQTNTAGVQAALLALQASVYALTGWGSMHVLGVWTGAQASTIETYLDSFANGYIFTRAMLTSRDASPASKWGGSGETETSWVAAIQTDYSAVSAKRIDAGAGYYNTPSPYPNAAAGAPRYRRPGQWSAAIRQVGLPPQRHSGRVRDGVLSTIIVDPTNDPADGFIYHDERLNPGLNAARFTSFRTRVGQPKGFFVVNPNLMAPLGSDFSLLPFGNVMDVACDIVHQVGSLLINDDIRLNPNGTIYENEAKFIEAEVGGAITAEMFANNMISGSSVVVDRSNNIAIQKQVNFAVTIEGRGYVLGENVTIGFGNTLAAQ